MRYRVLDGLCSKTSVVDDPTIKKVLDAILVAMRRGRQLCCLDVEISGETAIARTCYEYTAVTVRFKWHLDGDSVSLEKLLPFSFREEIDLAISILVGNRLVGDPICHIDEARGIGVFIVRQLFEGAYPRVTSARGCQYASSLYVIRRGEEPKCLFQDCAYDWNGGVNGRCCDLSSLTVIGDTIAVIHNTTLNQAREVQKTVLTFSV